MGSKKDHFTGRPGWFVATKKEYVKIQTGIAQKGSSSWERGQQWSSVRWKTYHWSICCDLLIQSELSYGMSFSNWQISTKVRSNSSTALHCIRSNGVPILKPVRGVISLVLNYFFADIIVDSYQRKRHRVRCLSQKYPSQITKEKWNLLLLLCYL